MSHRAVALLLAAALLLGGAGVAGARTRGARRHHRRAAAHAVAPRALSARALRAMDSLLVAAFPAGGPGAAALVSRRGRVVLRKAYGLADPTRRAAATPETPFRLGALAEPVIATLVLQGVAEGRLDFADTIGRLVGIALPVTIEQLLTHTSGIAPAPLPTCPAPGEDLPRLLGGRAPPFPPGSDWLESPTDYALLTRVLERIFGTPLDDALRARLAPAGLTATRCDRGELVSTVDDLEGWRGALEGDRLVRHDLLDRAFTPTTLPDGRTTLYGYGFASGTLYGHATLERIGAGPAPVALLWLPDEDIAVLLLSARPDVDAGHLAFQLAGLALGEPWRDPSATALDPAHLDRLTGDYGVAGSDPGRIERDGARLFWRRGDGARVEILAHSASEFFVPGSETRLAFTMDASGRAESLTIRRRVGPAQRLPRLETGAGGAPRR